jgi:hypothetical protein
MYREREICIQCFCGDNMERNHLEDLDVNIKMVLQDVGRGFMDWIDLAQDTEGWRALLNAVMKLRVP